MAEECAAFVKGSDQLPVKRPREEEQQQQEEMEAANHNNNGCTNESPYISSVLPGWFSEISPLWPGLFFDSSSVLSI